jgi:hypothetical protein
MQHLTEEQLILFHYNETGDSQRIARHLDACSACRHNYDSLSHTLGSMTLTRVPERPAEYGSDVWRRLAPQLASSQRNRLSRWIGLAMARIGRPSFEYPASVRVLFAPRLWCIGAGVLLLASAAFLAGRFWPQPASIPRVAQAHLGPPSSSAGEQRIPFKELGDHLERSQLALIELINSKTNGPVDISIEQVLARELVDVNRIFCRTAAHLDDGVVMSALEDLERALLEISNSPPRLSTEQFAELRRRLGPDAVLCKIKVVGAQLRARQAAQELAQHRS